MKQFTMVFTTRHRNGYAVERDCTLIGACLTKYNVHYKYIYNGKDLVVFHVYAENKRTRICILAELLDRMNSLTYFKSLDLQSYTNG